MGTSARPFKTVVVPDFEVIKLSAVRIMKDELVRVTPATSVSSKYSVVIKVIE